jgi:hypothetical protein
MTIFSLQDLFDMIREVNNINLGLWGIGEAKTAAHLVDEVQEGEAILEIVDGCILRKIQPISIAIYSPTQPKLILREVKQVFNDGRVRERNLPDKCSVAEKVNVLYNETPEKAAIKGILEELKIQVDPSQLIYKRQYSKTGPSRSYPGIITEKEIHIFECKFTQDQFNPDGYIEEQKDKTNHFKWINQTTV